MVNVRLLAVCGTLVVLTRSSGAAAGGMAIRSVDFEVFGRVQGVFFRKCTLDQATELGVRGWCKNTAQGTVAGSLQGPDDKVVSMMDWLRTKGSPSSQIDKAEFKNEKAIPEYTFQKFEIVKEKY